MLLLRGRELTSVGLVVGLLLGLSGVDLMLRHGLLRVGGLLLVGWKLLRLLRLVDTIGGIIRRYDL